MAGGGSTWLLKVDVLGGHPSGGTGARIFFGHFDGVHFTPEPEAAPRWADHGSDFYAALSWAALPGAPQRQVWLGWMNCHRYAKDLPTQPWRGSFSVPRELSVRTGPQGLQLLQQPVAASESLRGAPVHAGPVQLVDEHRLLLPPAADGRAVDVLLQLDGGDALECGLLMHADGPHSTHGTRVGFDARRGTVFIDRSCSGFLPPGDTLYPQRREVPVPAPTPAQPLRLRVLVDWSSVEVFVGDGEQVLTEQVLPDPRHRGLQLYARGGSACVGRATVWPMAPARIG